MDYEKFMKIAYNEAVKGYELNEVPIGCVITYEDTVIATGFNQRNKEKNSLYHAEIIAIHKACEYFQDWRLEDCSIFVTVEPCPMCSGAILQSRIKRLIYATPNKKAGCCGSVINIMNNKNFNHNVEVIDNILNKPCEELMKKFFQELRSKN